MVRKKEMQKAPRESPPHGASHTPPAEMKHTWEAADLVQDFTTRWRARGEHLSNYYSTQQQKREIQEKDEQLIYVPHKHPNTYPRKFIQNTL
jgi:hypothetical protein